MAVVYFKSCKRCGGDQSLVNDLEGWYMVCLRCGYVSYPRVEWRLRTEVKPVEGRSEAL